MVRVVFTPNLNRHIDCPPLDLSGETVGDVLKEVVRANPRLGGYVLDDRGRLRQHVVVFVNGRQIEDRRHLDDPVGDEDEVYVMQALSGGGV